LAAYSPTVTEKASLSLNTSWLFTWLVAGWYQLPTPKILAMLSCFLDTQIDVSQLCTDTYHILPSRFPFSKLESYKWVYISDGFLWKQQLYSL